MNESLDELGLTPDLSRLPSEIRDLLHHGIRNGHLGCSEGILRVCTEMFRAGHGVSEVWMILIDLANAISKEFFSKKSEEGETYLERIISQAHDLTKTKEPSMT